MSIWLSGSVQILGFGADSFGRCRTHTGTACKNKPDKVFCAKHVLTNSQHSTISPPAQTLARPNFENIQRGLTTHRLGSCPNTSATVLTMAGVRDAAPQSSTLAMSPAERFAICRACMTGCRTRCSTGSASSSNFSCVISDLHASSLKVYVCGAKQQNAGIMIQTT